MLYSLNGINNKIANIFKGHPQKVDLIKFFTDENLIEKAGLRSIYLHDKKAPFFINEQGFAGVSHALKEQFGVELSLDQVYTGKMPLQSSQSLEGFQKFAVKSVEDVNKLKDLHAVYSTYGIEAAKQQEVQNAKKQEKVAKIEEEHEANRQAARREFDGYSNLNRDFDNVKIVSIDFEFFLNKRKNEYALTEMGIAISDHGEIKSYHYLVKEHYERKKNRSLQEKFAFGDTLIVSLADLKPIVDKHLDKADYVLFHEMREDRDIMLTLGYDFSKRDDIQILDTQLSYKRYFRPKGTAPNGEPLDVLLKSFKIDAQNLHNGGNDAYYTLQLLLKMSAIHKTMLQAKQETGLPRPKMK